MENGALAEPTLVTQANVINITDVMAEEPEATIREERVIIIIYKDAQFVMPLSATHTPLHPFSCSY